MGNCADFFLNPEQRGKARAPQLPYVIDADVCAYGGDGWGKVGGMGCTHREERGGDGRGNLRENREDPAPTVGIVGIALRQTVRFRVTRRGVLGCDEGFRSAMRFLNRDAARHVATVFEKWNFLIENDLRARRENPPKRLNLYRPFAAVSLLEYGGLKPILQFLGGRSDAACRVAPQNTASHPKRPPPPSAYTIPTPTPYHRRTFAATCSGFALKRNPNM